MVEDEPTGTSPVPQPEAEAEDPYSLERQAALEAERAEARGVLAAEYLKLRDRYGPEWNGTLIRWGLPTADLRFLVESGHRPIEAEGGRIAINLRFQTRPQPQSPAGERRRYEATSLATTLVLPPPEVDQALPPLDVRAPARQSHLLSQSEMVLIMHIDEDNHAARVSSFNPGFTTLQENQPSAIAAHTNLETVPTIDEVTLADLLKRANELFEEDDRRRGVPERDLVD